MKDFMPLRAIKTVCLLVICCCSVGLAAQDAKVSVNFNRISLKQALAELQAKSGYNFLYNSQLIDDSRVVNVNKSGTELSKVLDELFAGTDIRYSVDNKQIVLYLAQPAGSAAQDETGVPAPAGAASPPAPPAQNVLPPRVISGTITDDTGEPLPGTVVSLKGNPGKYDIADADGQFALNDVEENAVLVISCFGYETLEQPVGRRNTIAVSLKQAVNVLGDVVVTGYQTLSRERAAGAFNVIKNDAIARAHSSDLSAALLGTTAGMQGKENEDGTIDFTIRGVSSLYADATPLIVVDGFPVAGGFKDINPNDVESVTVLKDAAAASIWGARSGNGVIVVTTKKAKQAGELRIEASAMVRVGTKMDLSTVLTTALSQDQVDYEKYYFENGWADAYPNIFIFSVGTSQSLASEYLFAQKAGKISLAEMNAGLTKLSQTNNRGQIKDHLLQHPVLQQYNVAISQASERSKNYVSVLYENQLGSVIENSNNRWKLNFNNQTAVFKWLDFNISANLHYAQQNTGGPTMSEIASLSPYEMILNEDGSYATQIRRVREQLAKIPSGAMPYDDWNYNLLREVRGREWTSDYFNTRVIAGLTFKILPELTYSSNFMYEYNNSQSDNYYSEDTYYVRDYVNKWTAYTEGAAAVTAQYIPSGGILQPSTTNAGNYSWRNQVNYNQTFNGKHNITALAGMEITENEANGRTYPWVFGYDPDKNTSVPLSYAPADIKTFITDGGPTAESFPTSPVNTLFSYRNDRYVSIYGNAAYSFDGKYNVTASVRSDASNMIADDPSYRWSPLWSIGGMWHAHKESFVHDATASWLNQLTARLTFGYNGNVDKTTSPYTLLSVSPIPDRTTGTFTNDIAAMGNPTLRWERTHTLNFGIDFAVFNNLLFGSIDVYNKEGKDIIGEISLPSVTGANSKKLNVAGIYNRGIEVELGVNAQITEAIGFTTKLTYAYNKNKITRLFRTNVLSANVLGGSYMENYPVNALWAYNWLGMEGGKAYVEGADGQPFSIHDGSLHNNVEGLKVLQYMGPAVDPHTLGWTGMVNGYGLNLSFTVTGKFGGHFRNPVFSNYRTMGWHKNIVPMYIAEVLNGSGKQPTLPVAGSVPSDFNVWGNYVPYLNSLVESSSFVKLKEITLEYHLPEKWMDVVGLERVKVYGQVRDLGCLWTNNSRGYDPEWQPGSYKPVTTYALGVNINF